jgi:hypothetical protein
MVAMEGWQPRAGAKERRRMRRRRRWMRGE